MRRCPGSATEDFTDDVPRPWWDGGGTVRCNRCGKRVGLYAVGSATARQAGANDWRMKTHYVSRRCGESKRSGRKAVQVS